ncbi:MAG TPA: T9SS type A sorting domain-containing protein [bacterium]|jgi:hypothetical protein
MTRSLWIGIWVLCGSVVFAQPNPLTRWTRTIAGDSIDTVTGIVQTGAGTYLLCGYTGSWGAGGWDMYVAALDSLGNSPWYRTYGTPYHDAALAIRRTADNYYIVTGYSQTQENGPLHVYLMKISSLGIQQWNRTYTGTAEEYANDVQQTTDGGYILTGASDAVGQTFNIYLRKTDAQGNPTWTRYINHNDDAGYSVQQTADGGYIIAGRTHYFEGDGYLVKTDATGHSQWTKYIGGSGDELFRAVKQTYDGGYIVAGKSNTSSGDDKPYLVKTDSLGRTQWTHTYGPAGTSGAFYSVDILADSNYIVSGTLRGHFYIARIDTDGIVRWDEEYTNSTWSMLPYAMQPTRDDCYIMAGYTTSQTHNWDFYILKTGRDRMTAGIEPRRDPIPLGYALSAYPNPFNASTTLSLSLPHSARAHIGLYDVSGRQVGTLADGVYEAGEHRIGFDGSALPSGIYFARLSTPDFATTQKLMLLK